MIEWQFKHKKTNLLPQVEGDIFVFHHVCNLAPHCKDKENNPVTE